MLPSVRRQLEPGDPVWVTYTRRPARPGVVIADKDTMVVVRYADATHPVSRKRIRLRAPHP